MKPNLIVICWIPLVTIIGVSVSQVIITWNASTFAKLAKMGSVANANESAHSSIGWITCRIFGCRKRSSCFTDARSSSVTLSFRFGLCSFSAHRFSNRNTEHSFAKYFRWVWEMRGGAKKRNIWNISTSTHGEIVWKVHFIWHIQVHKSLMCPHVRVGGEGAVGRGTDR